jgi:hypothetical protein
MTDTVNLPSVIGLAEIADLYEVSKTTVGNWTRRADWPRPIANLKMGPVWDAAEVVAHKTPASRQQFQVRCAHCYSDAVVPQGVNYDCSFTVECGGCGERSTFKIAAIKREGDWPITMITVAKEDA